MKIFFQNIILSGILLILIAQVKVIAQSKADTLQSLREIDQICAIVKDNIERKEFLVNEFKLNANYLNKHLPQVFQYVEKYYYTFAPQEESEPEGLLRAVALTKEKEGLVMYREFIFDTKNQLVFYAEKARRENTNPYTLRKIYFKNEKPIQEIKDLAVIHSLQIDLSAYLSDKLPYEAHKIQKKFKTQFAGR